MPESVVAQCQSFTLIFKGEMSKTGSRALDLKKFYDLKKIIVTLVSTIYFDIKLYLKGTFLDWISTYCSQFVPSL